jgi:hypothetical protein
MKVIDQFRDPSFAVFINLVRDRPWLADQVKEADVEDLDDVPDSAFAWREKRAFAVHSRAHTIYSRVYRENSRGVPGEVDRILKEACDVYGLPDELFARPKTAAAADSPDDYLLPDLKRLRVKTAADVKVAEQKLLDGYTKLSVEHRALACRRLLEKAAALNVPLQPLMRKLAGFTVSSTQTLRDWIEARREATKEPRYKAAFQKLAEGLKNLPAEVHDREALVKIAEVIDELDKKAGLQRHYDRRLPDPLMSVFNTEKLAGPGVNLGGKFVPLTRLASYPATFYGDVLGHDIVREASDGRGGVDAHKLAMILETLPSDMKMMLAQHIR